MERAIKKLRYKIMLLSLTTVFIVLLAMVIILNVVMRNSYLKENDSAIRVIADAVLSADHKYHTKTFILENMEKNEDGDIIVRVDPTAIESVTLYGSISASDTDAKWYNTGGGLMFEVNTDHGNALAYREYNFNENTSSMTVDFTDYSNVMIDGQKTIIDPSQITGDYILVSIPWWSTSSKMLSGNDSKVALQLNSAEIHFTKPYLQTTNFTSTYPNGIPAILGSKNAFCLITDKEGTLCEINTGSLLAEITEESAEAYIRDRRASIDNVNYDCTVMRSDTDTAYIFMTTQYTQAMKTLFRISVLLAIGIFILLGIGIYNLSGIIIKPVMESYDNQKTFISNAGHELKTPITVISATADIMEQKGVEPKWVDCIKVQSLKMKTLVGEMLELSRLSETKKQQEIKNVFNFTQCVNNAAMYFESRAYEENKPLTVDVQENMTLSGDERKIERLVGILIDNALKYSNEKGTISLQAYSENEHIHIICKNPCTDFKEDKIHLLFERFYRGDESHSDKKEGYGLGLSIAEEIVALWNGKIHVSYKRPTVFFDAILKR